MNKKERLAKWIFDNIQPFSKEELTYNEIQGILSSFERFEKAHIKNDDLCEGGEKQ